MGKKQSKPGFPGKEQGNERAKKILESNKTVNCDVLFFYFLIAWDIVLLFYGIGEGGSKVHHGVRS